MLSSISPRARAVIDRLAKVDFANPVINRAAVERALRRYLAACGAPIKPIHWYADAAEGLAAASASLSQVAADADETLFILLRIVEAGVICDFREVAAIKVAPSPRWSKTNGAFEAGSAIAHINAEHAAREAVGLEAMQFIADAIRWNVLQTRDLSSEQPFPGRMNAHPFSGTGVLAAGVVESAALIAAFDAGKACRTDLRLKLRSALALIDAYEAGLWMVVAGVRGLIVVPRPVIRLVDARPHCEDGPAVWWPDGARYYFWRGVLVPEVVISGPETLTRQQIVGTPNLEVRRAMIDRIGIERFLALIGSPQPRHEDHTGILYRVPLAGDPEPLVVVRVTDPSTGRQYFLRVPPEMRTAREAVAWSFGMKAEEWNPNAET